jgi:hypothetical protein
MGPRASVDVVERRRIFWLAGIRATITRSPGYGLATVLTIPTLTYSFMCLFMNMNSLS